MLEVLSISNKSNNETYLSYINKLNATQHLLERNDRLLRVQNAITSGELQDGKFCFFTVVDKGHKNGPEIHTIFDNGLIVIQNERTEKFITVEIARPGQIYRYFQGNRYEWANSFLRGLINLCKEHKNLNWNNW